MWMSLHLRRVSPAGGDNMDIRLDICAAFWLGHKGNLGAVGAKDPVPIVSGMTGDIGYFRLCGSVDNKTAVIPFFLQVDDGMGGIDPGGHIPGEVFPVPVFAYQQGTLLIIGKPNLVNISFLYCVRRKITSGKIKLFFFKKRAVALIGETKILPSEAKAPIIDRVLKIAFGLLPKVFRHICKASVHVLPAGVPLIIGCKYLLVRQPGVILGKAPAVNGRSNRAGIIHVPGSILIRNPEIGNERLLMGITVEAKNPYSFWSK